jgi:hypothetical protein
VETSVIHELLPSFKERNHVLFLLLGLVSVSKQWMSLVEAEVSASQGRKEPGEMAVHLKPDEGLTYFLLGTISFSSHILSLIESAGQSSLEESGEVSAQPPLYNLRDLLR